MAQPHWVEELCPHCSVPNAVGAHVCSRCGTPLTAHAVTDPLGQIYSEGDIYRKAIANPRSPIVLIGMWLLFGPLGATMALVFGKLSADLLDRDRPLGQFGILEVFAAVFLFAFIGALGVVSCLILYRVTRNFYRRGGDSP